MKNRYLLVALLLLPVLVSAQRKNRYKYEFVFGLGAANFLGELGGANAIGSPFVRDLELSATRPAVSLGVRYKNHKRIAFKGNLFFGILNGDDKLTKEPYRYNRNLHFRAPIVELSGQAEFYVTHEQPGHLYKIKNAKGMKRIDWQTYLFLGGGGFFFNPQARYDGRWVNLQPLGTEGQGLPGGPAKYKRINACLLGGAGIKYSVGRKWSVGLEYGVRKTFTDYIDDVSGVYYDNNVIAQERGAMAAKLANPSPLRMPAEYGGDDASAWQAAPGSQRGDSKDKDWYMFGTLNIGYKFIHRKKTRSKF